MQLSVRGHEIAGLLDRAPAGVEVLSLDCFDTLIWRDVHAPHDVFAGIDLPGGGVEPRSWAEQMARRVAYNRRGALEIGLTDVYRALLPQADAETVTARAAAELALEARHAFAFAPVVGLIAEAKRRGLTVIIVSDMYLSEAELRAHIAGAAGEAVLAQIDHVFVSGAQGCGKESGLFDVAVERLGVAADRILHFGDNPSADGEAAAKAGLHSAHFVQFDPPTAQRLRHEASAAAIIDPTTRVSRPVHQPHRAAVSLRASDDPAYVVGHDVLGPVMHSFASWVRAEIDAMAAALGRPVRPLFVMRDGYLPWRVFDQLYPDAGGQPVEISRFVAARASIHDDASLDAYVGDWLDKLTPSVLARHLMLFEAEVAPVLKGDEPQQREAFAKFIRKPDIRRKVLKRTGGFTDKLMAHLGRAGVRRGDAVMLVDIGFNGTVQNIITPVLAKRMGLTVAGRYLFLRETQLSGLDKRGLIDVRGYDNRTLHALSTAVVAVEQLCNVEQGSTVNFRADGAPVREEPDQKAAHHAARGVAQRGCLDFARDQAKAVLRPAATDTLEARARAAAATLARLLFLPSAEEAKLFASFTYDVNLGSNESESMIDATASARAFRRRGVSFVNEKRRMFLSGDLQPHGLPMTLANFATHRFALDLRMSDFDVAGIEVPAMLVTPSDEALLRPTAYPTVDGFYRLQMPVGASRPTAAVQLGAIAPWIEVEEVSFNKMARGEDRRSDAAVAVTPMADAMEVMGDGLYRAQPNGMLIAQPPLGLAGPLLMTVVFRPIGRRAEANVRLAA